jgi:hypothetical protein
LTSAISGRARACPSRLASSIASTQPALQGAIAAFVSFCNLPQGFESFPTAAQYTSARGDSASMSRNGQRSDFTSRREAGAEPSVHLLPLSCLSYLCDDLGRVTFCLVTNLQHQYLPFFDRPRRPDTWKHRPTATERIRFRSDLAQTVLCRDGQRCTRTRLDLFRGRVRSAISGQAAQQR